MRSRALLYCVLVLVSCARAAGPFEGPPVTFTDEGATQAASYDGLTPKVEVTGGNGHWSVTAYQGQQRSGGYAIRIERGVGHGTALFLRARFTTPAQGAATTAVITSPAHTIGLAFLPDAIVLYDQDERERARWTRP